MKNLQIVQRELEEQGTVSGKNRFDNNMAKAAKQGREDGTHYGMSIIEEEFPNLLKAFDKMLSPNNRRTQSLPAKLLEGWVCPKFLALTTLKGVVSHISSSASMTSIARQVGDAVEMEFLKQVLTEKGQKHLDGYLKKMNGETRRERIKAAKRLNEQYDNLHIEWTTKEILSVGVFCVHTLVRNTNFVEIIEQENRKATKRLVAKPAMTARIARMKDEKMFLSPIYLPMVVKPRDWTLDNLENGCYLTDAQQPISFVKRMTKKQRRMIQKCEPTEVLEAVNIIQGTSWKIRPHVLELLQTLVKQKENFGMPEKRFVPQKNIELVSDMSYKERKKAEAKNKSYETLRMVLNTNLATAEQFKEFDNIYIPHQLDRRGRVYPVPALNPQGQDYIKALLQFSEGKELGKHGLFWLKYNAANLFGKDKLTFSARIKWVDANLDKIYACALDPMKERFWAVADYPFQFYAVCCELLGAEIQGEQYKSHMPVNFDGSCSGLQHLGAAFRCEITAKTVNLLETPAGAIPEDIYNDIAVLATEELKKSDSPYAKLWLELYNYLLSRDAAKSCVMTYPYGSTASGFKQQLLKNIITPAVTAGKLKLLPEDKDGFLMAGLLAPIMEAKIKEHVVKAAEAMRWMQETMSLACVDKKAVYWLTPPGFPVVQEYYKVSSDRVDLVLEGQRYRVSYNEEEREIDKRKMRSSVSPNVVHSLDSTHLMMTVLKANREQGLTDFSLIHDSFGVHAADSQTFFETVRETFVDLYSQPVFERIKETLDAQIPEKKRHKAPELPERGSYNLEEIKESLYAFA